MASSSLTLHFQFLKTLALDEICPICRDSFQAETTWGFFRKIKVLGHEGHIYHPECLKSWLETDTSCPTCRGSFTIDSLKKVFMKLEVSKDLVKKQYGLILGGVATVSSLASRLSFSAAAPLSVLSFLSFFGTAQDKDVIKSTAIACATAGMGAIGAAAGLESEGVMLAGLLGASIADELLKTKPIYMFFED